MKALIQTIIMLLVWLIVSGLYFEYCISRPINSWLQLGASIVYLFFNVYLIYKLVKTHS